ncbi:Uncharacterised protein [Vibrio cholerae]|nr:Uncharacterised protein [Vibrio cholerae]
MVIYAYLIRMYHFEHPSGTNRNRAVRLPLASAAVTD